MCVIYNNYQANMLFYNIIYNIVNYGANMNFKQHTHEIMQNRPLLLTYTVLAN